MKDDLLPYYERELDFIRKSACEFAEKYPKIARRLQLEATKCDDPHVERLIEAFALLAARVSRKLDDEFPEITEALLGILYPHYLRPIPSMSMVQFEIDPELPGTSEGHVVERGAQVFTDPVRGMPCLFRTCYPVRLWPVEVASAAVLPASALPPGGARAGIAGAVRLVLRCRCGTFASLHIPSLRFFLNGEGQTVHALYERLFTSTVRVLLRSRGGAEVVLPSTAIREVGFRDDEALLPYSDRSFAGYRLLQEYFAFPEKFLFFDLAGLEALSGAGFGDQVEILVLLGATEQPGGLARVEHSVTADTFRLGCAPVVNLFPKTSEPIRLSDTQTEYRVVPDVHSPLGLEVYSVDSVTAVTSNAQEPQPYQPFYSVRHGFDDTIDGRYWHAVRRASGKKGDDGTEVYLSFVDLAFDAGRPAAEAITARLTCTNRDVPARLPFTGEWGDLQTESGAGLRIRPLRRFTPVVRPPMGRALQWRLISHLSLNHLSIVEGGCEALREILMLYDFSGEPSVRRQIAGLAAVASGPAVARVVSGDGVAFCRGVKVDIEFDEEQYAGSGVFLLASVLERFLGLYSSINSFSQLSARTRQRKGVLKEWSPRAGEQVLL